MDMAFPLSLMDVEEEVKMLEEYKEALTKRLEQVNKRIEALKR
jgi:ubiquinone biosynthesis protein UbiJ